MNEGSVPGQPVTSVLRRRLVTGGAWTITGRTVTVITGLTINGLITRLLAAEEVGTYFLCISMVMITVHLAQLGLDRAVVRLVAEAMGHGRTGQARGVVVTVMRVGLIAAVVIATVLGLGGRTFAGYISNSPLLPTVMWFVAVWLVIKTVEGLLAESFRGFHDIRMATISTNTTSNIVLLVILSAVFWLWGRSSLEALLFFSIAASAVNVFLAVIVMKKKLNNLGTLVPLGIRYVMVIGAPLLVTNLMIFIFGQADIWIIGASRPTEEVAVYGAAARLVQMVILPAGIINAILPPIVSEMYSLGNVKQLENIIRVTSALAAIPAACVLLVLVFASNGIMGLIYGDFYRHGGLLLILISAGQFVNVWAGSGILILMMTGNQIPLMKIVSVFGVLLVVAGIPVVKYYGATGMALIAGITTAGQALATLFYIRHKTGMWTHAGLANMSAVVEKIIRQKLSKPAP